MRVGAHGGGDGATVMMLHDRSRRPPALRYYQQRDSESEPTPASACVTAHFLPPAPLPRTSLGDHPGRGMCRRRQLSLYPVLFAKQNRQLPAASYTQKGMSAGRNGRWQFGILRARRFRLYSAPGVFVFRF